jgi:hypothetical protein
MGFTLLTGTQQRSDNLTVTQDVLSYQDPKTEAAYEVHDAMGRNIRIIREIGNKGKARQRDNWRESASWVPGNQEGGTAEIEGHMQSEKTFARVRHVHGYPDAVWSRSGWL